MANINTGYRYADAFGVPAFETLDTYVQQNLVAGAIPALRTATRFLMADSLTLAQFTVVGLDSSGKLVVATYNATVASAIKPIGVLAHAATSGASNSTIYGEVWLTGCFNADADSPLVWDATFDTLAKKTTWPGLPHFNGNPDLIFRSRAGGNAS
jgi:hypothetical protein